MRNRLQVVKRGSLVAALGLLAVFGVVSSASAHSGEFAKFNQCPSTNPEAFKCLYSVTNKGEIILGKKTTPIVNPVILQGAYTATNREKKRISKFLGALNGETLTKVGQPVPGGLLGIVPPESAPFLVKLLSKFFFENGLTGVNAILELAKPASEIEISEFNVSAEEGLGLKLPVKVRLENPFLGSSCYVGSSSKPIIWPLTTGETEPKAPNTPIHGSSGTAEVKEGALIAQLNENILVENNWSAPEATGCGGVLSFLVDPLINSILGLPAKEGTNTAILKNTIDIATATAVNEH
jgi:hypothetical protein